MSLMEMISEEPFHHDHRERMRDYLACSVIWPFVMVFFIVASICMIPPLLAELSDYVIEKKKGDRK